MENIDLFDNYYKNELNTDEIFEFEQNLKTNKIFYDKYESYLLSKAIIKNANLKNEIEIIHQEFINNTKNKFNSLLKYAASLAIILMIGVGTFKISGSGASVLESQNIGYVVPQYRGANENDDFKKLYLQGNYKEIVAKFSNGKAVNEGQQFLTSMAYFKLKEYNKSERLINLILILNPESKYKNELKYYQAQALVGQNRVKEALVLFDQMKDYNPYYDSLSGWYMLRLKIISFKY